MFSSWSLLWLLREEPKSSCAVAFIVSVQVHLHYSTAIHGDSSLTLQSHSHEFSIRVLLADKHLLCLFRRRLSGSTNYESQPAK